MIYTRIEWIWPDEGLKETFVESCGYEGEFVMCGGDSGSDSGGGGGGFEQAANGGPGGAGEIVFRFLRIV